MHEPEPRSEIRNPRVAGLVVFLAALALSPAGASLTPAPSEPALHLLAQAVESDEVQQDEWPFDVLDPVVQVAVRRAVLDGEVPGAVELLAAGEITGDEETARALLWAALSVVADPFPDDCEAAAVPPGVEAALLASVLSPEPSAAVVSTFGLLLGERWRCPVGRRVLQALGAHHAIDVAIAWAPGWAPDNEALLELAFSLEGPTPRVLLAHVESSYALYGVERAAALELAQKQLLLSREPAPAGLGHDRLVALLDAGLAGSALSVWLEIGDQALDEAGAAADPRVSRRLDMAAAAVLAGRPELARALLPHSDPPKLPGDLPPKASWEERRQHEVDELTGRFWQALELSIEGTGPGAADPFDLLAELALVAEHAGGGLSSRGTLLLFLGQLSEQLGYPAFASYFNRKVEWITGAARASLENPRSEVVRSLAGEIRLFLGELAPFADAPLQIEPARTRAPEEERLPAGFRVRVLREAELESDVSEASIEAPSGFGLVRSERSSELDVVLATSQAIDPVGELSPGGYWILLSADGGASWQAWPTGLRVGFPYEAVAESRRPLLTEDGLAIEVRWARIDEGSITFPPVALAVERHEDPLVIEIPWAVLRADHDRDGLSDLHEERLFTDPERADTDGDGVTDFDDPLPGVAYSAAASPASEALEALLRQIGDEEQGAILPRCPGDRPGLCFGSTSPGLERTLFVVGEPGDWAGLVPPRRTVVLTPEQMREAEARWGPVYATRFPLLAVDRNGRQAVIIWSRSWQGGAARLEKTENGWVVEIRSSWIT